MKRVVVALALVAVALAATWAAAETEIERVPITWQQAAVSDGEALYVELCAACHGVTGKGDGPAAPALAAPLSDLTRLASNNQGEFPATRVERAITGEMGIPGHGSAEMPVWGKIFESVRPDHKAVQRFAFARYRIYNLTEYLRTLQVE